MLKRIGLIFRAPWICSVVNTVSVGISAADAVLVYIKGQVEGSEAGENIIPRLEKVLEFLATGRNVLNSVGEFVCGSSFTAQNTSMSIDEALNVLDRTTVELKNK